MRFEGACRLMFGIPCDPADVSDLLESISILGCTLFADRVAFARYEPGPEMWHGGTRRSPIPGGMRSASKAPG
ncbi:MAG: hypothetical protein E6K49_03155 [Gammaproteobacteria bacterium]|nr:MAG: hypothetical protein E6K49_03155 [Gammaproteobacteria bacterium]